MSTLQPQETAQETPREFAERKKNEKKSKIDAFGRDASVLVTKTRDTKGFVGAIQKLDDAVAQVRNNLGRPGGATWEQLVAIMDYTDKKENEIRIFANNLLKGKYDIPTSEELKTVASSNETTDNNSAANPAVNTETETTKAAGKATKK